MWFVYYRENGFRKMQVFEEEWDANNFKSYMDFYGDGAEKPVFCIVD